MLVAVQGLPSAIPATVAFQVINLILIIVYMSVFSKRLPQGERVPVTTLSGRLLDQAALFGVLNTLYDLHLPLLSVECRAY